MDKFFLSLIQSVYMQLNVNMSFISHLEVH